VTRVSLVGRRAPLAPALVSGLGRLGQQRGNPCPRQLLDYEPPPGAALHRERHIATASEPLQPLAQRSPGRRGNPAPPDLSSDGVQIVESDLSAVNVKPSYDGHHRDLLKLLNV